MSLEFGSYRRHPRPHQHPSRSGSRGHLASRSQQRWTAIRRRQASMAGAPPSAGRQPVQRDLRHPEGRRPVERDQLTSRDIGGWVDPTASRIAFAVRAESYLTDRPKPLAPRRSSCIGTCWTASFSRRSDRFRSGRSPLKRSGRGFDESRASPPSSRRRRCTGSCGGAQRRCQRPRHRSEPLCHPRRGQGHSNKASRDRRADPPTRRCDPFRTSVSRAPGGVRRSAPR